MRRRLLLPITIVCIATAARAAEPAGIHFAHDDWEIACDNTRTCRAAGYQADDDALPVSVLLTRKAGPAQAVTGQLRLGGDFDEDGGSTAPSEVVMTVDGAQHGTLALDDETRIAALSPAQVDVLLAALRRDTDIEFVAGGHRWHLSDSGASAVLLKMDEFQRRLGTTGALVRKGNGDETSVLPPLPLPVVAAAPLPVERTADARLADDPAFLHALRAAMASAECAPEDDVPGYDDADAEPPTIVRLSERKLLVSELCWRAAYNQGVGNWVVDDTPPFAAQLVTTEASDGSGGLIVAAQKGRGIGDCWSIDRWTWDGAAFVLTESKTTGMCRLVAAGGAWDLPTYTSKVRRHGE